MNKATEKVKITVEGIPAVTPAEAATACHARLVWAVEELCIATGNEEVDIRVGTGEQFRKDRPMQAREERGDESSLTARAQQYAATKPLWNLSQLIAPPELLDEVRAAVELIRLEPLVFDSWGLRSIEPFPRSALNFHGPPGTGKTMTAHVIAVELGKNILVASYAQIESKYHGDGPKNVEALFHAAERDQAVLFIDEADSLLSKRLTNVTQGSEQAINSMRSQILICLERYRGVVIFATNLVTNYDQAFETRVRHIHFPMPDAVARAAIWRNHLLPSLPLGCDVDAGRLAEAEEEFCGRDIKNAVVNTALRVARQGRQVICHVDLEEEIRRIVTARNAVRSNGNAQVPHEGEERKEIEQKVMQSLSLVEKDSHPQRLTAGVTIWSSK
ncbi:ATP-binding protein [Pelobacter propionicus]|uniref:AAA ATPase, central domain protein n=1 Tax=Pelobacter propionicus (strain DSM 2379 / NBRC 103807 / OttBd1) TaxID=338966 RepID=A1AKD8_PELPD|nr:ATP-binding protein [Pelobacter propionicus]ABK97808.1 AAA ATPase, central domain protein [Pelobacter propionicus DSM 2379]